MLLALCVLGGCDGNEPVAPVTPDEPIEHPGNQDDQDEPTPSITIEEEDIRGSWLSVDPGIGWLRIQFNEDGTYHMLKNENANSQNVPKSAEGSYILDKSDNRIYFEIDSQLYWNYNHPGEMLPGAKWSFTVKEWDSYCLNAHLKEETGMVDYNTFLYGEPECRDYTDWSGNLTRILYSADLKIGESITPAYEAVTTSTERLTFNPLCKNGELEVDPASGKITARQQGLFYVEVQGDKGKGLIEIYSSDFQEMPFDQRDLFNAYKASVVYPLTKEMGWKWDCGRIVETPYKFVKYIDLDFESESTDSYLWHISIELVAGLPGNLVYHVVRKDKNVVPDKYETYWYEGIACGRFPGYGYELTDSRRTVYISNPIVTYSNDGPEY